MKDSQAQHSWRRLSEDWDGDFAFSGIETTSAAGFNASSVTLTGGLLVLAGVNSSGKSRMLRALERHVVTGSSDFASVHWSGGSPTGATYIDMFELVERQVQSVRNRSDFDSRLEEFGSTAFNAADLRELTFLVGRQYDSVQISEFDATYGEADMYNDEPGQPLTFRPEIAPIFRAERQGAFTDSRSLSRGELSAMTLLWVLQQAQRGEVLIWDEPDAFLSPVSAGRALDLIADRANKIKTPMAIASHGYLGLASTPQSLQAMLRLRTDGTSTLESPNEYALWQTLKVTPPRAVAFVVEDSTAKVLLSRLLTEAKYPFFDLAEIWTAGDSARVVAAAKFPNCTDAGIQIVGVVDGDAHNQVRRLENAFALPGNESPETIVLRVLEVPAYRRKRRSDIEKLLDGTMGKDPHNRVDLIARGLGLTSEQLVVEAHLWWIAKTDDGKAAFAVFRESALRVKPPMAQ